MNADVNGMNTDVNGMNTLLDIYSYYVEQTSIVYDY